MSALFIGLNVEGSPQPAKSSGGLTGQAMPAGLPMFTGEIDDDDTSEEDYDDLIRAHSRIMKQQEYEARQRDGYVDKRDSS